MQERQQDAGSLRWPRTNCQVQVPSPPLPSLASHFTTPSPTPPVLLRCNQDHRNRADLDPCKFQVEYEECDDGTTWVLRAARGHEGAARLDGSTEGSIGHNHTLHQDAASVMAEKGGSGRFIPQVLVDLGRRMARGGSSAAQIDRVLRANAKAEGIDDRWEYKDVLHKFVDSTVDEWDFSEMALFLLGRERNDGLKCFINNNKQREVNRIWFELEGAFEEWAVAGKDNVLLFDPTYQTNRHGMKLACFVSISPDGASVILAACVLNYERAEDIQWAFECFHEVFKKAPNVLFTDDGGNIKTAFREISLPGLQWSQVTHLLCVFHISKNIFENLSKLFSDRDLWKKFFSLFWRIAKETDSNSVSAWDEDWASLNEFLDASGASSDSISRGKRWLAGLGERRTQWAARWTWGHLTYLIHSTQRSEAINSAVKKKKVSARSNIKDLVKGLVDYNEGARKQRTVCAIRLSFKRWASVSALPPYMSRLQMLLTPFAFEIVLAQWGQKDTYELTRVEGQANDLPIEHVKFIVKPYVSQVIPCVPVFDEAGEVSCFECDADHGLGEYTPIARVVSLTGWCSCQYDKSSGVPYCRHKFKILGAFYDTMDEGGRTDFLLNDTYIAEKWKSESRSDCAKVVHALRVQIPDGHAPPPTAGTSVLATKQDRFLTLLDDFREIASAASHAQELTLSLSQHMKLWSPFEPGQPVAPPAQAGDASQPDISADGKAFLRALGDNYIVDKTNISPSLLTNPISPTLHFTFVAVKYSHGNKGGWHVGQITSDDLSDREDREEEDEQGLSPNCVVQFNDGTYEHAIVMHYLCAFPLEKAYVRSWVPVLRAPLSDPDIERMARNGDLRPPSTARRSGGPETKRKAKSSGPTSRSAPRTHGRTPAAASPSNQASSSPSASSRSSRSRAAPRD